MNKHKFLAIAFGATLIVTACKKTDIQNNAVSETTSSKIINEPVFKSYNNWAAQTQENYTIYTSKIEDSAITSSVASKGMVLVYKKGSNSTVALPNEEKGNNQSYFWYYQVSEGSLLINADAYGSAKAPGTDQSFIHFILSPEKLTELAEKGYSKGQLMRLTYENAIALLK